MFSRTFALHAYAQPRPVLEFKDYSSMTWSKRVEGVECLSLGGQLPIPNW